FAFHRFAVLGIGGGFGGGAFTVLLGLGVLAFVILAVGIFAFGFVVALIALALIAQRQMVEHGAGQARESLLVAQGGCKLFQVGAGLGFDGRPPQINCLGQRRWRFFAGQLFAHYQAQ